MTRMNDTSPTSPRIVVTSPTSPRIVVTSPTSPPLLDPATTAAALGAKVVRTPSAGAASDPQPEVYREAA